MSRKKPIQTSAARRTAQQKQAKSKRTGLYLIGGVVALAVILVGVLIYVNTRPPADAPVGDFTRVEKQTWPDANGKALGPENAKVNIVEYADFQCPVCKTFNETVQRQIIADYVSKGNVRYEFHHFIVIDQNVGGSESRQAAIASECANEQKAFWDYHEVLFANQGAEGGGSFTDSRLKAFAESLGLDTAKFNSCLDGKRYASAVKADEALGMSLRVNGTPSLFINGQRVANPLDYNTVKSMIDAALAAPK